MWYLRRDGWLLELYLRLLLRDILTVVIVIVWKVSWLTCWVAVQVVNWGAVCYCYIACYAPHA